MSLNFGKLAKGALDFGSRVYDQINMLDSGRDFTTRTPNRSKAKQSVGAQFTDIFNANSDQDKRIRLQDQRKQGLNVNPKSPSVLDYRTEQRKIYDKDQIYTNPFKQIAFGNFRDPIGRGVNSLYFAGKQLGTDTVGLTDLTRLSVFGTNQEYQNKLNQLDTGQKQSLRGRGLWGLGANYNNFKELNDPKILAGAALTTGADVASVLPAAKGLTGGLKGAKFLSKPILGSMAVDGLAEGTSNVGEQLNKTGMIDWKQVGTATAAGTAMPVAFYGAGKLAQKAIPAGRTIKQNTNLDDLVKQYDVDNKAVVKAQNKVIELENYGGTAAEKSKAQWDLIKAQNQKARTRRKIDINRKGMGLSTQDITQDPDFKPKTEGDFDAYRKARSAKDAVDRTKSSSQVDPDLAQRIQEINLEQKYGTTVEGRVQQGQDYIKDLAEIRNDIRQLVKTDPEQARLLNESLPDRARLDLSKPQVTAKEATQSQPPKTQPKVAVKEPTKPTVTVKDSQGNLIDPNTGDFIDRPANTPDPNLKRNYTGLSVERKPLKVTTPDGETARLGGVGETFFDGKKGNQKISYPELDGLGKEITRQTDAEFRALGTTYDDVARKVQEGANNKIKVLEEAGLTPAEADIVRRVQKEMNYVRRRASLGGKEISNGDLGEMYLPRQKEGQYKGENLFEGFRDTKPGSEFKRTGKMALDDIDNDASVIGEYITRYGDTKLYQDERIIRAFKKNNPDVPEDKVIGAAQDYIKLQNEINDLESSITLGGAGRRQTKTSAEVEVKTAERTSAIGKKLGREQALVDETPRGFTNGDKINSVEVHDQRLGDYLGMSQYRDAQSFSANQVKRANGNRNTLKQMVEQRLKNDYDLPDETVAQISESIGRIKQGLPDELVEARVMSSYKMAAKQQMMENLLNVDIQNKTTSKTVSELANQILREGSIERKMSAKLVSNVLTTTNAIFRKFNISSAINELSDVSGIVNVYGRNSALAPDFKLIKEFGLGEIDPAIAPYIKAVESGKSLKSVLSSINSATNLYKFVETYKAAVMASSSKKFHKNLKGDALVKQILEDYRTVVLPVDAFTKTVFDTAPLYTQYMSWAGRNLQKEFRFLTGGIDTGVMKNKSVGERIARNMYANLPAKTVFWLASNGLKGTALLTAFGLQDFTGLTEADYSGISKEDKSLFDKTTELTNRSTVLSLINSAVQSWEKEQLKDKYKDAEYNPYKNNDLDSQIMSLFTPQAVKSVFGAPNIDNGKFSFSGGAEDLRKDGYSENKSGRVQYEAPDNLWDQGKSYVFGKNSTQNAREYGGRQDIVTRIKDDGWKNSLNAVKDMAAEQLNIKETDYNRPLTQEYSDTFKELDGEMRKAMLEGGRAYNQSLDNLRRNQPEEYNNYINSMDGNHVSPERWREIIGGNADGGADLTVFNMMKERKVQLKKDMDRAGKNKDHKYDYDPLYDLPDNQARQVLQMKATATGEDLALRNILFKEDWYKDYDKAVKKYYNQKPASDVGFTSTERVKRWNGFSDQYNELTGLTGDTLQKKYPLVWQLKQFEFGSPESEAFLSANYDAWKAQKDQVDTEKLKLINAMREIEGSNPMSLEAYQQATKIAQTKEDTGSSFGFGGGGSRTASRFRRDISLDAAGTPARVTVKAAAKPRIAPAVSATKVKPKVKLKASRV